ncbi:DUF3795 domain-containing protein [Opitutus terrae]|uniref:DUF3795 domain-containing protein n=1 Tax=Opitutus terrae (strain DSM 11246 / JCM 15787 / PB90-1) TaxID=452637 RepID=B1ZXP9_OPITP|nr:DUF3795 domain-containing protein [Opitutus terrae]ACB74271.1 hypothetical protein Oter_0983 [Opitutus terrae PB90-1]
MRSLQAAAATAEDKPTEKLPDLKSRAYCGLICDDRCELYHATQAQDPAAMKAVHEKWQWKQKHGIDDPALCFCHGCKPTEKQSLNVMQQRCTVRVCAMKRGFDSCIQCQELVRCEKELWKNWPKFKQQVEQWQKDYVAAGMVTVA